MSIMKWWILYYFLKFYVIHPLCRLKVAVRTLETVSKGNVLEYQISISIFIFVIFFFIMIFKMLALKDKAFYDEA